jgi:hypothetical protein
MEDQRHRAMDEKRIYATLEFDGRTGRLRSIFTSAQDDEQFESIKKAIGQIFRPNSFSWIR